MGFTTTYDGGSTSESSFSRSSEERKLAIAMQRGMDRLSFEPALVLLQFDQYNSNMQNRMMDLIMGFLNMWADKYTAGVTREGEIMHRLGEMSVAMLGAVSRPTPRRGRLP